MSIRRRILYVGSLVDGGTCLMRMNALHDLGHEVRGINTAVEKPSWLARLSYAATNRLGYPRDLTAANRSIVREARRGSYDILWIDAVRLICLGALDRLRRHAPNTVLVAFIMDDPFSPVVRGWKRFRACVPYYDLHFVIRDENIAELKGFGARRVERYHKGFCRAAHRPVRPPPECPTRDVFFAGHWEPKREADIAFLLHHGIRVTVAGHTDWRTRCRHLDLARSPFIEGGVYGKDYAAALSTAKIALCFYSQWNRDKENSRMYEVPACGAFMLAERNEENIRLFEEGKEAEFFDSKEELLDKVRYYLRHDAERRRIATAGRERCLRSGYSYHDRLREMMKAIENARRPT